MFAGYRGECIALRPPRHSGRSIAEVHVAAAPVSKDVVFRSSSVVFMAAGWALLTAQGERQIFPAPPPTKRLAGPSDKLTKAVRAVAAVDRPPMPKRPPRPGPRPPGLGMLAAAVAPGLLWLGDVI